MSPTGPRTQMSPTRSWSQTTSPGPGTQVTSSVPWNLVLLTVPRKPTGPYATRTSDPSSPDRSTDPVVPFYGPLNETTPVESSIDPDTHDRTSDLTTPDWTSEPRDPGTPSGPLTQVSPPGPGIQVTLQYEVQERTTGPGVPDRISTSVVHDWTPTPPGLRTPRPLTGP